MSTLVPPLHFNQQRLLLRWLGWFLGGNAVLFWLVGLRYIDIITPLALTQPNFINQSLAWLFLSCAYLGQLSLLAFLPGLLLIPLIFILPKRGLIFCLAIFLLTANVALLFLDTIIFEQYRFHVNSVVIELLLHTKSSQIFDFSWLEWLILVLGLALISLLEILYSFWLWHKLQRSAVNLGGKKILYTLLTFLLFSYYLFLLAGIYPWLSFNQQAFALPLYENILSRLFFKNSQADFLENIGAGNFTQLRQVNRPLNYPLHPLSCPVQKHPFNIVIIGIDSWRFDLMTATNTPHIYQFSEHAWQFPQHFSGGNGTRPGLFSLFYSLPAAYWTAMTDQQQGPVLFEILKQHGYRLGIFASATLANPAYNHNIFSAIPNLQVNTPGATPYARDKTITTEFIHFIQTRQQQKTPFFSFLFYNAPHSFCYAGNPVTRFQPALATCDRLMLTNHTDPLPYYNRYKNALYYSDDLVGQDLTALTKAGDLKNTIVIITGDHGNEFNDNHLGYWGHASNFMRYQVQTPLLVYWPGKPPQHVSWHTSHYDIVPTLLSTALFCQNPSKDYSIGKSLFTATAFNYLLVSSYIDFGIIEHDKITRFFPTGSYTITTLTGHNLPATKPNLTVIKQAFATLTAYYQRKIQP